MKLWFGFGVGVVLLGSLPSIGSAQAVGGAGVGTAATGATATTAAAPRNLWSFLCPTPEQKAACKAKFCNSGAGQLFNNGLKPASALTGGVIPLCCPPGELNAANLKSLPDSALGAAASIQQDEAGAKARRAAVRYLGTVDCNYWPEAQAALIDALRADRNECVRLEAAWALSRGCCCKKSVIQALVLTVSGSRADDNPAESCDRVKVAAAVALDHCLACYSEVEPVPIPAVLPLPEKTGPRPETPLKPRPETLPQPPIPEETDKTSTKPPLAPVSGRNAEITPLGYYDRVNRMNQKQLVAEARQALARTNIAVANGTGGLPDAPNKSGLVGIITTAFYNEPNTQTPAPSLSTPANQNSPRLHAVPSSTPAPLPGYIQCIREKLSMGKKPMGQQTNTNLVRTSPDAAQSAYPLVPVAASIPRRPQEGIKVGAPVSVWRYAPGSTETTSEGQTPGISTVPSR